MHDTSTFRTEQIEFVIANFVDGETWLITIHTPRIFGMVFETIIGDELDPFFS